MTSGSLAQRYAFKLGGNAFGLGIAVAVQAMVPRALGPVAYGNYSFLFNFFQQVVAFLDLGTSQALFNKLSRRPDDPGALAFYRRFGIGVAVLVLGFLLLGRGNGLHDMIWPGQEVGYVWLAAGLAFATWLVSVVEKAGDARGLTRPAEINRMAARFAAFVVLAALYAHGSLGLTEFFLYNYLACLLQLAGNLRVLERRKSWPPDSGAAVDLRAEARDFWRYCHPLAVYAVASLAANMADRWLLQRVGGSEMQGYFALSWQIGAVCALFTAAMTPLVTREFAMAVEGRDLGRVAEVFRRTMPPLIALAAFFGGFVAVKAETVILLFGGTKYVHAWLPTVILAFYPMAQTVGQAAGALFFATGETRSYRNIGVVFLVAGIPLTYALLAPRIAYGLDLGAPGLAAKTLLVGVASANVMLYCGLGRIGVRYPGWFAGQIYAAGSFVALAWLADGSVRWMAGAGLPPFADLALAGVGYSIFCALALWRFPRLFGLPAGLAGKLLAASR